MLVLATVVAGVPAGYMILDTADDAGSSMIDPAKRGSATGPDGAALVDDGTDQGPTDGADAGSASPAGAGSTASSSFDLPSFDAPARASELTELTRLLGDTGALLADGAPVKAPRLDFAPPLVNPLRAALLMWVETTGTDVPADELARALDDADRLPASVQRDLSILVAAAAQASTLQREALSALTPEEIAWLEAHPNAARALAKSADTGVMTPDAEKAAALAARVDPVKSVQAALLLTNALEQTRESLKAAVDAGELDPEALRGAPLASAAPDNALAFLDILAAVDGATLTREAKLGLAGDLIVAASGLTEAQDPRPFTPDLPAEDALPAAMLALAAAADPVGYKDYEALLEPGLARARALPQDLQRALAIVVLARAETLDATRTALLSSGGDADAIGRADAIGALKTLSAMERALPVLQKYALVYGDVGAPGVAHVTEPAVGYVETYRKSSAFTQASTRLEHSVRAAGLAAGVRAEPVPYDGTDLPGAVQRLYAAAGLSATKEEISQMKRSALSLPLPVQNAAAVMVLAAADAQVLRDEAFAELTDEEYALLFSEAEEVMALVNDESSWTTREDVDRIAAYAELAGRVDDAKLLASALTLAAGADAAKRILEDAGYGDKAYEVQSLDAKTFSTGFRGLADRAAAWLRNLVPFGTARAQESVTCAGDSGGNDILFCDPLATIFITGTAESTWMPALNGARPVRIPILLDLGGRDTYGNAVGTYGETWNVYDCDDRAERVAVGLLLDMGGDDVYDTPDGHPFCFQDQVGETPRPWRGAQAAGMGGVGFIVDAAGNDYYKSYSHTQGYGWFGVGALLDASGDDTRESREFAQGASFSGFGLHLGLLVDREGTDTYDADKGQGYGVGGVFVELLGEDQYRASSTAHGLDTTAYLHLDQEPARMHSERGNLKVWRDGPSNIHLGYAVDTYLEARDTDGDQFPDFLEALLGSDPGKFSDTPESRAAGATREGTLKDSDKDGFSDILEHAMGTDPESAKSAPVGAPGLPRVGPGNSFAPLFEAYAELMSNDTTKANGPYESDKILDVRMPFPGNGVTIENLCADWHTWAFPRTSTGQLLHNEFGKGGGRLQSKEPERDERTSVFDPAPCSGQLGVKDDDGVNMTIPPAFRGGGNTTMSRDGNVTHSGSDAESGETKEITVRVPPGLFALGNVGPTSYDVEYLLQTDLGGQDEYHAATAGGTFLRAAMDNLDLTGEDGGFEGAGSLLLPVGLVSFDLDVPRAASAEADNAAWGRDVYVARAADGERALLPFAHGAGGGILVDTEGSDRYEAGAFSQGALAGLLLDLSGMDYYSAGDHSQGANVAFPFALHEGLGRVQNHEQKGEERNPAEDRSFTMTRHAYALRPALLLDLGTSEVGGDWFEGGNRSQGYGYGLLRNATAPKFGGSANTMGRGVIVGDLGSLVDLDGTSVYVAKSYAQGVARGGGVGLLVDAQVNRDVNTDAGDYYSAEGPATMGAIEPEHVNRLDDGQRSGGMSAASTVPQDMGGLGALVDMSGLDRYIQRGALVFDRTEERQDSTTVRTETANVEANPVTGKRYALGIGVHADYEASQADRDEDGNPDFFESLAGTRTRGDGADNDTVSDRDVRQWLVHLPTARFAIGGTEAQNYTRDYAFVVDFGGENVHTNNAGGPVTDLVLAEGGEEQTNFLLTAFPVTFVYEAANADTTYLSGRDLTHGVGYFTVGMLVDEGGEDVYRVLPDERASFPSGWTELPPVLNGDIRRGASEWATSANTLQMQLAFEELQTAGLFKDVELYVSNDAENLYVGVQYTPIRSPGSDERDVLNENEFWMFFDNKDDGTAWFPDDPSFNGKCSPASANSPRKAVGDSWTSDQREGKPGMDAVRVWKRSDRSDTIHDMTFGIRGRDGGRFDWHTDCDETLVKHQDVTGVRRYRDGVITIEFRKPLNSEDPQDIALMPDGQGAWEHPAIGFHMELRNVVTGEVFTWPPRTTATSGAIGSDTRYNSNGMLDDELEDWALLTVSGTPSRTPQALHPNQDAFKGVRGVAFDVPEVPRVFSQGAGVGGMGVLAALGNVRSSSVYEAGAFALGFGGWQGTGVLFDGGGSDRYTAKHHALGAAVGIGKVMDIPNQFNTPTSGRAPSYGSYGLAMELDGNDVYAVERAGFGHSTKVGGSSAGPVVSVFLDTGGSDSYDHPDSKTTLGNTKTAPTNNLAWLMAGGAAGGAYGTDLNAHETYFYRFTRLGVSEPAIISLVHPLDEDGECDTSTIVNGRTNLAYVTEAVCLRFFVPETTSRLAFERLDVLTGNGLVASMSDGVHADGEDWGARSDGVVLTLSPYDPRELGDGVRALTVRAYYKYAADEDGRASRVLYGTDSRLNLLVDTLPVANVEDEGPTLGDAIAFSPTGVGRGTALRFDWAVSRDLAEERYALNGYPPLPHVRSQPCAGDVGRCDVLPFYFTGDDGMQPTPPSQEGAASTPGLTFPDSASDRVVSFQMPTLSTDLRLAPGDSLGFWLYRDFLAPAGTVNVETRVVMKENDPSGGTPRVVIDDSSTARVSTPDLDGLCKPAEGTLAPLRSGVTCTNAVGSGGGSAAKTSTTTGLAWSVCGQPPLTMTCTSASGEGAPALPGIDLNVLVRSLGQRNAGGAGGAGAATAASQEESLCRPNEGGDDRWVCFTLDVGTDGLVLKRGRSYTFEFKSSYAPGPAGTGLEAARKADCDANKVIYSVSPPHSKRCDENGAGGTFGWGAFPRGEVVMFHGTPDYPSRVEFLVESEPSSTVAFTTLRGQETRIVENSPLVPGDLESAFAWAGEGYDDGLYTFNVTGSALTPAGHFLARNGFRTGPQQGEPVSLPVLLDSRAPEVDILTPSVLGNPLLTAALEIPIRWRVTDPGADAAVPSGSGVESVNVFATAVDENGGIPAFPGSGSTWTTKARDLTTLAREKLHRTESGVDNYVIVVVARDRVGNVGGLPADWKCDASMSEAQCLDAATTAAVQAKLAAARAGASVPGVKRVTLDLTTPVITDAFVDGGILGSIDGNARRIVRAGGDVTFTTCVQEAGTGLEAVNVFFVREPENEDQSIITHKRALTSIGNSCYAFDGWGDENTDASKWPNGNWTIGFEAFDRGANKAERLLDTKIFLDGEDPVADARLVLPEGQTALRPGQSFSIEIDVADASGVTPGSVTATTGAISTKDEVQLRAPPAGKTTYRALVTVDKTDVAAGEHLVPWTLADAAGNAVSGVLTLNVTIRDYEIEPGSVRVTGTTFNGFTVAWNTTAPAKAQVAYGLRPLESDLTKRSNESSVLSMTHAVTVTDLAPNTRYFFKAVSTDDGGLRKDSKILEVVTDTALYLDAIALEEGDALSGNHRLAWTGGLHMGEANPRFTVDVRENDAPWQFITTLSEGGAEHGVIVNTTRLLDGGNYSFRVTVESGRETVTKTVGPVTIDNTPPEVAIEAGLKATRDTRPVIAGVATDALSGLAVDAVQLTIDGERVQDALVEATLDEDGLLAFEYKAPQALEIGPHNVGLVVTDLAGSAFVKNWTLHVDVAPAEVKANPVAYAPGPLAAKDGGEVTLNLTVTDPAGLAGVTANLSGLRANATEIAFTQVPGTDEWTLTFTVTDPERDGTFDVPVRVTDEAGNVVTTTVPVLVDTAAPALLAQRVEDVGLTSARVRAEATEPVRVTVTYDAPKSKGDAATELFTRTPTLPLAELLPSRTYAYTITVSDGAGNTATDTGTFTTADDTTAPAGVQSLTFFDKRDGRVRVEWPAASDDVGVDYYRVYRGTNGTELTPHAETAETFFEESGLPLETEHRYAIAAVDHGGNEGPRSPIAAGASTSPPVLTDGGVSPEVGSTHTTTFKFTVTYRSAGGVAPAYVRVVIDGVPHDMLPVEGEDPREGVTYAYETRLAPTKLGEPHVHHFEASDGRYVVKFPKDAAVKGPLVSGDLLSEESGGLVNFAKRIPAAGFGGVIGGVVLAAAAVLVITRRRSLQ